MTDRGPLLAAKLRALVGARTTSPEPADYPGGAALVDGSTGWVLLDTDPLASLGPALVWADRRGLRELHLLADDQADVIARRAALFADPPTVWAVDGTELRPAEPAPVPAEVPAPPAAALAELLVDRGNLRAQRHVLLRHDRQRLGAALEQRDQRLGVALLAVQVRQALGRRGLRWIAIDRDHQRPCRAMRVTEGGSPHIGRLRQPVARKGGVAGRGAHLFEQKRVPFRVALPGCVSLRDRVLVVRIFDQSLDQRLRFTRVHSGERR